MNTKNEVKEQEKYIEKIKKLNRDKSLKYSILTMGCPTTKRLTRRIWYQYY